MSDSCPKCGVPIIGKSCPRCGLVFELFFPEVLKAGVPDSLIELWLNVEKNWDDKACHALFVEQAIAAEQVGYAAACYRRRGDDAVAADQIARLGVRLEQAMTIAASGPLERSGGRRGAALLLLLLIISAALFGLFLAVKSG